MDRGAYWTQTSDVLDISILKLLRAVPRRWLPVPADTLSAADERALHLLTAAGLIERRVVFRLALIGHPVRLAVTLTATGEHGFAEAMEPVVRQAWELWADGYRAGLADDAEAPPRVFCESIEPEAWRLTAEGELAQQDAAGDQTQCVLDFVYRRTMVFEGKVVPGYGKAERIEQCPSPAEQPTDAPLDASQLASPTKVEVTNLSELHEPMAQMTAMMQRLFEKLVAADGQDAVKSTGRGRRGPQRMRADHAWRYLSTVQAWAAVQKLNAPKPQRERESKKTFARRQGITVHDLNAMLAWYRKYQKQGLFPEDPQAMTRDELNKRFA